MVLTAAPPAELLPEEHSKAAKGLSERKRKVKAQSAMRERSNMPPALLPAVDWSDAPMFGWHKGEDAKRFTCD